MLNLKDQLHYLENQLFLKLLQEVHLLLHSNLNQLKPKKKTAILKYRNQLNLFPKMDLNLKRLAKSFTLNNKLNQLLPKLSQSHLQLQFKLRQQSQLQLQLQHKQSQSKFLPKLNQQLPQFKLRLKLNQQLPQFKLPLKLNQSLPQFQLTATATRGI